jgi:hypothetical protein
VPASVELGDFDPSSTAIAVVPGGELARLPPAETRRTFERYYDELMRRRRGEIEWEAYSPYELRTVGVLVRLGRREQALEVLHGLLADRRPLAWNQWAEIVWRDAAAPKFIGDMPHTWVGSGYAEAVRDLFAYEREDDGALVVAAGIPADWIAGEAAVGVKRMPTHFGVLNFSLQRTAADTLRFRVSGDLDVPPGGIIVQPPLPGPLVSATVNGEAVPVEPSQVRVQRVPADVVMQYASAPSTFVTEITPTAAITPP